MSRLLIASSRLLHCILSSGRNGIKKWNYHLWKYEYSFSAKSWLLIFLIFFFNVYFWERKCDQAWGRGREKTEDPKQNLFWQQRAPCRARTPNLWDRDLSQRLNWVTQVPQWHFVSWLFLANYNKKSQVINTLLSRAGYGRLKLFFLICIYLERAWAWVGERQREDLCVDSTESDAGLHLTNCELMTWASIKSWRLNQLSHPGTPRLKSVRDFPTAFWLITFLLFSRQ